MIQLLNLDELKAPAMLAYVEDRVREIHSRARYMGPALLPSERVDDLEFEYLRGRGEVPVMAEVVDFASPAPVGTRWTELEKIQGELVTSKQKLELDVKTAQKIERALASKVPDDYKGAIRRVFDDVDRILAGLAARVEMLRWQAIVDGTVTYTRPDIYVRIDYRRPSENVFTTAVNWSDLDNATPLTDIMTLCDRIADRTGVRPARAVCPVATWSEILRNRKEVGAWLKLTRPTIETELRTLMADMGLPSFATYDVAVASENPQTKVRTNVKLVPANTVILLPPADVEIGKTLFGPTPTEVWNAAGYGDAIRQMEEGPRFVVRMYREGDDPGTVWTIGEVTAVPAMTGIEYVGRINTRRA